MCGRASSRIASSKKATSSPGLGRTEVRWLDSGEIARDVESAAVFWFRNGKIVRWQPFGTYDAALKAVGLAV
jgi:hypothetical protein